VLEEFAKIKSDDVVLGARSREDGPWRTIRMRRVPDPEPAEKVWLSRLGLTLPKCNRRHDETDQDDAVPTFAWNEDILETKRGRKLFASPFHFPRPADFRAKDYMEGSFGAMRGDGDYDVVLRFGPQAAGWIKEKTWHSSQVLEEQADGSLIVKLHVNELRNVRRWVMFWGIDCEVIGPPELRELVSEELSQIVDRDRTAETKTGPTRRDSRKGRKQERNGEGRRVRG
jgi:hypothetical protein